MMRATRRTIGLAAGLTAGLACFSAHAAITVPGDHPTIQQAIDAAPNGEEIIVAPGTWYETLNFNGRSITLRSSGGAAVTTIDGQNQSSTTVTIGSGDSTGSELDGFTITGGRGQMRGFYTVGGGLYVYHADIVVRDCLISGNTAGIGGGAWVLGSDTHFDNCTFSANDSTAVVTGGGGFYSGLGEPLLTNCRFENNDANSSGGGATLESSDAVFRNCAFSWNTSIHAAGIAVLSSSPMITGSTFAYNAADDTYLTNGGGIKASLGSEPWVANCVVWHNTPSQIIDTGTSATTVAYSFVEGGWSGAGTEVYLDDPKLELDGLHLLPGSPCVDRGDNSQSDPTEFDLDGNDRIIDGDEDGEMVVDVGAFELIANLTSAGACCQSDGTCVYTTIGDCDALGGIFGGAFVDCDEVQCVVPPATGACCTGLDCAIVTIDDCDSAGGTWIGVDTTCAQAACDDPDGACCLPNGFCMSAPAGLCEGVGGTWLGAFSECSSGICEDPPILGACCVEGDCVQRTELDCRAEAGVYHGDGISCSTTSCSCPGDLNGDGTIDITDLMLMVRNWGGCAPGGCAQDLNADGLIALDDLIELMQSWGPCP